MTKSRKILLALGALAAIGFAGQNAHFSLSVLSVSSGPSSNLNSAAASQILGRNHAEAFVEALTKNDISSAVRMFAVAQNQRISENFQTEVLPLIRAGMQDVTWKGFKVASDHNLSKEARAGDTIAVHRGVVQTDRAGLVDIEVSMIRVGGVWKVVNFRFKTRPGTIAPRKNVAKAVSS